MLKQVFAAACACLLVWSFVPPASAQDNLNPDVTKPIPSQIGMREVELNRIVGSAHQIFRNFTVEKDKLCKQFDCEKNTALLRDLYAAEALLTEYVFALSAQDAAYERHYQNLLASTDVSTESIENARQAIILHRTLHDTGSALLDFAAILSFDASKLDFNSLSGAIDSTNSVLEGLKDLSSLSNTVIGNVSGSSWGVESGTPAGQPEKTVLDVPGSVAEQGFDLLAEAFGYDLNQPVSVIHGNINDDISLLTNLKDLLEDSRKLGRPIQAKSIKGLLDEIKSRRELRDGIRQGVGFIGGRLLKSYSADVLENRRKRFVQLTTALSAEADVVSTFYQSWKRILIEQSDANRALTAVTNARRAVEECVRENCGFVSIGAQASYNFVDARTGTYRWGRALRALGTDVDALADNLDGAVAELAQDCPPPDTAAGPTPFASGLIDPTTDLADLEVTATCPECRSFAEQINVLFARRLETQDRIDTLEDALTELNILKQQRDNKLRLASRNQQLINSMTRDGRSMLGSLNITAATFRGQLGRLFNEISAMRDQIDLLTRRTAELPALRQDLDRINEELRFLRERFQECEREACKAQPLGDFARSLGDALDPEDGPTKDMSPLGLAGIDIEPLKVRVDLGVSGMFDDKEARHTSDVPAVAFGTGEFNEFSLTAGLEVIGPPITTFPGGPDGGPLAGLTVSPTFRVGGSLHLGGDALVIVSDQHPTPNDDVFYFLNQLASLDAGLGFNVGGPDGACDAQAQTGCIDFSVTAGPSVLFIDQEAIFDESGGGGLRNVVTDSPVLLGWNVSVQATGTLCGQQECGLAINGFARATIRSFPGFDTSATTQPFGFQYLNDVSGITSFEFGGGVVIPLN
ncbi:MAG: hypothetical protein AAF674_11175 [Pseudomonadota bacterium]